MSNENMTDEQKKAQEEQAKIEQYVNQFKKLLLVDLNTYPYRTQEKLVGTYTKDDLRNYIKAPELEANQKVLRKISKFLYNASSQYRLLVNYFTSILTFDHYVRPNAANPKKIKNKKSYEDEYYNFVSFVEKMNLKHEFAKISEVLYRDGVYCGYAHQEKNDFFFQQLDTDYCKITYFERGMYFISFNLTYFYTYPERLAMYPQEFRDAYNAVKNNIKNKRSTFWYPLKSENTICIKTDESNWYFLPPFVSTFEAALNISDFKQLDKSETEVGNYKLLFQKIPINEKGDEENKFLLTPNFAQVFHDNIQSDLPAQVGLITSPMEVTPISFDKDQVDKNKVEQVTSQYWSDAGVSQLLFSSSGKSTAASLAKAIMADEAKAFLILNQFQRWVNIYLSNFFEKKLFSVDFLRISHFNRDEFVKNATEAATYGLGSKAVINAALGNPPSSLYMESFLENEILGLQDKLIPLSSSHTKSGDDKGGRPKSNNPLSESGEKTLENDSNNKDVRE